MNVENKTEFLNNSSSNNSSSNNSSSNIISSNTISSNISVIIPLYNKLDFIIDSIDSVLKQTKLPGEIIIIDDGSTDGCANLVENTYGDRIILVRQSNGGESVARNTGIDHSRLDYIALLDADDQWEPSYLEEICQLIHENPGCNIFATAYQLVHPDHVKIPRYHGVATNFRGVLPNYFRPSLGDWSVLSSSSTVIRKNTLLAVGKYTLNLKLGADIDLWCKLALGSRIAFSNRPLARYLCFNASSTTLTDVPNSELQYSKRLTLALKNNEIPQAMVSDVKKFIAHGLQYIVREQAKKGNIRQVIKFLIDRRLYFRLGRGTLKMGVAIVVPTRFYECLKNGFLDINDAGKSMQKWLYLLISMSGLSWIQREIINKNRVTILLFHAPTEQYADKQFHVLTSKYNIITLREYINVLTKKSMEPLPPKPLIITYDDGVKENFLLWPLLEKHNIPVTIFLCSGIIGTNRHYWWTTLAKGTSSEELEQISNDERLTILAKNNFSQTQEYPHRQSLSMTEIEKLASHVDFQSHTCFHPNLPQCSDEQAHEEIHRSKIDLEQKLSKPIYAIAFPNGANSARDIRLIKESGYECALTTQIGFNDLGEDKYQLKRIDIRDSAGPSEVIVKASGAWHLLKKFLRKG